MRQTMIAAAVAVLMAVGTSWAQPQMPTAGPEHQRLNYFEGTWTFSGEMKPGPMGPGGAMSFTEKCTLMEGGFALVCSSEGKSPMGPTKAHSIMTWDAEKKAYTYTAAESNMPVFVAIGHTDGPTWTWTTESDMMGKPVKTRVLVKEINPKSYEFSMEMAMGGDKFMPMMSGKAVKAGS